MRKDFGKGLVGVSCDGPRRGFRGVGTAPKRSRIDTVGIKGEHTVVEFAGGRRLLGETYEVVDIAPRLGDVTRRVVGMGGPWPTTTALGLSASILSMAASQLSSP